MKDKQILLTAIKNCWPTTIGYKQLISIARNEYDISATTAKAIIDESLRNGEISRVDDRFVLEKSGYDYLDVRQKNNTIVPSEPANSGHKRVYPGTRLNDPLSGIEKILWVALVLSIISLVLTIVYL